MFWHRQKKSITQAIQDGDHLKLRRLLSANPRELGNRGPDGEPLLFRGIASGKKEIVKVLLAAGADANERGPDGDTPLVRSFALRTPDIAKLLLAAGADPELPALQGVPPLHIAAYRGRSDLFRLLLEAGADPAKADLAGGSALAAAAAGNQAHMVRALLQAGTGKGRRAELESLCRQADGKGQSRVALAIRSFLDAAAAEETPTGDTAQVYRGKEGGSRDFLVGVAAADTISACMEHLACAYSPHIEQQRIYSTRSQKGTGNLQVAFAGIAVSCGAIRIAGDIVAKERGQAKPYRYADLDHILSCCCGNYLECPFYAEATAQRSAV